MDVLITINGKKHYVPDQTTVFEACHQAGVYIPHFCYHPKLSIAANCRMCLVQIDKAPKPVPSCAIYVTDGMAIYTNSPSARAAQKGVMEFLLINHPLDCPICDQGGECQLQDLAMGYGSSSTRYGEAKRVVVEKNLGPLITTVMTRCIHCTRCVRFGEEIAGNLELGVAGRGEHAEIMPFLEETVDSELSGNMIDVCPVGALNSKPFRFSARTWELLRHDGIAQHDSWGSMIRIQTKEDEIKRVLPREYEEINECWISDRDRFAYTGIDVPQRCTTPHVLPAGGSKLQRVEWSEALGFAATLLEQILKDHGPEQIGFLLGPALVSEEGMLASELLVAMGGTNIDHRLRQSDFSLDSSEQGVPWLGCSIEEISQSDHVLLVGSNPAHELPLLPVRLRRALAESRMKVSSIGARSLEKQLKLSAEVVACPSALAAELARVCAAVGAGAPAWVSGAGEPQEEHQQIATFLREAKQPVILLGEQAINGATYGTIRRLANSLATQCKGRHGILSNGANNVGLALAGAVPQHGFMFSTIDKPGLNVAQMLDPPLKAYVLIGCEPLDFAQPAKAEHAFAQTAVISIGSYIDAASNYADAFLPAALFAERRGATVNLEGNAATMAAVVNPPGESRPTWKILRVLGNMLGLEGFDYEDLDKIRDKLIAAGDYAASLNNRLADPQQAPILTAPATPSPDSFERILEAAHYGLDQIVRRAAPLQATVIAQRSNMALLHPADLKRLGLVEGDRVELSAGEQASVSCVVGVDHQLARGCLRAPLGSTTFAALDNATTVTLVPHQVDAAVAATG